MKSDIQKAERRFVGFVNHQAGAFLLPGEFKKGTHFMSALLNSFFVDKMA